MCVWFTRLDISFPVLEIATSLFSIASGWWSPLCVQQNPAPLEHWGCIIWTPSLKIAPRRSSWRRQLPGHPGSEVSGQTVHPVLGPGARGHSSEVREKEGVLCAGVQAVVRGASWALASALIHSLLRKVTPPACHP